MKGKRILGADRKVSHVSAPNRERTSKREVKPTLAKKHPHTSGRDNYQKDQQPEPSPNPSHVPKRTRNTVPTHKEQMADLRRSVAFIALFAVLGAGAWSASRSDQTKEARRLTSKANATRLQEPLPSMRRIVEPGDTKSSIAEEFIEESDGHIKISIDALTKHMRTEFNPDTTLPHDPTDNLLHEGEIVAIGKAAPTPEASPRVVPRQ